jgi:hypothetical protein
MKNTKGYRYSHHHHHHHHHYYHHDSYSKVFHFARDLTPHSNPSTYVYDEENGFTIPPNKYVTILLCEAPINHRYSHKSICYLTKKLVQNIQPTNSILVNNGCSAIRLLSHPGVLYMIQPKK